MPEQRFFKLCGKEKYLALTDPDAIAMLLADFAWYEIPAWDYERRNRQFAHKVFVTPKPESQSEYASGDDLSEDDYRNEGAGYFDIA